MNNARQIALESLLRVENEQSYSSIALGGFLRNACLSPEDAALASMLLYGVIERKITIDYNLSLYLKKTIRKMHPTVCAILRLGAFQILFTDRIPVSAAVNESVKLTSANGVSFASGLVNAVLRKVAQNGLMLPENHNSEEYLSVYYSCPPELISHLEKNYGAENARMHLEASLSARPIFIRRNPLRCSEEELLRALLEDGVKAEKTEIDCCYVLSLSGNIQHLNAFKKGFFHVQDMSSQICATLAGAKPGNLVVDCCAAPGGKSFTMAQNMLDTGRLISCDIHSHKTELISSGAERLGLNCIETVCADALTLNKTVKNADVVLCDVPCSGIGVIGRKPEIRYKALQEAVKLPELQYAILNACSEITAPGGTLVYSTCTLNPAENNDICSRFLHDHSDFIISPDPLNRKYAPDGFMTIFTSPMRGDGFFAARFERKSE